MPRQEPLDGDIHTMPGRQQNGQDYYRLRYRDATGHVRYKGLGRGPNKLLNERARALRAHLTSDTPPPPRAGSTTVAQAWSSYEQDRLRDRRKSTQQGYKSIWNRHLNPHLGELPVQQVTRERLRDVLETSTADLSTKTRNHVLEVMKTFFTWCVDDAGLITRNPASKICKQTGGDPAKLDATGPDINALKRELDENWSHQDYLLIWTLEVTGLRFGEALALRWGDLFGPGRRKNVLRIRRDFVRGEVGDTKTKASRRDVPVSERLGNALSTEFHRQQQRGKTGFQDYIFTNGKGKPLCGDDWRKRVFNPASKKAGVHFHIKDLRDYAITRWVESGDMNLLEVQEVAGHTQPQTTMGYFRRSGASLNKARQSAERLGS